MPDDKQSEERGQDHATTEHPATAEQEWRLLLKPLSIRRNNRKLEPTGRGSRDSDSLDAEAQVEAMENRRTGCGSGDETSGRGSCDRTNRRRSDGSE